MAAARLRLVLPAVGGMSTLQRFLLGSALVHVGLAVTLILAPSLFGRHARFQDVTFVDLVAAPPGPSRPAAKAPSRPAPAEPAPPEEGVRAEPEPPKPTPERVEPVKKPKKDPEPAAKPPPRPATPPPDAEAAAGSDALGPELAGAGDATASIESDIGGTRDDWYRSQLVAALYGRWRRPELTGTREVHEVTVSFDILRDGRVENLRLEQSSGIRTLDRSALRAVSDAAPLPPIPSAWHESRVPAVFVFRLHPDT